MDIASGHFDFGAEVFEALEVEVDGAVADDAAAGQGDHGFAGAAEERAHHADGGAHFSN